MLNIYSGPQQTSFLPVEDAGPTYVEIRWLPPPGNYDGFRLVYQTPSGPEEVFLAKNVLSYRLNYLDPSNTYEIKLYTRVADLESVAAETEVTTSKKKDGNIFYLKHIIIDIISFRE